MHNILVTGSNGQLEMNFLKPCHSDEFPGKVTRPNYSVLDKTKIKKALDIEIPYWRVSMLDCIKTLD